MTRIGLFSLLMSTWVLSSTALAQSPPSPYPAHSLFTATKCQTKSSFDPLQDGGSAKNERDIVGDATYPALFVYNDQTHAYFRIRLDGDPITTSGGNKPLKQFGWAWPWTPTTTRPTSNTIS